MENDLKCKGQKATGSTTLTSHSGLVFTPSDTQSSSVVNVNSINMKIKCVIISRQIINNDIFLMNDHRTITTDWTACLFSQVHISCMSGSLRGIS